MLQSLEMSSRFSTDGRKEGGSGCLKICLAGRTRWRARSALAVIELINSWRTDRQNCCLAARNPLVVVGATVCLCPLERWRGSNPFLPGLAKNLKLLFPQRIRPQMTPFPLKRDEDLPMPRSIPGMAYGRAGNGEMISSSLGPPFRPRPRPSCPPCMLIINDLREAPPSLSPPEVAPSSS